MKKIKIRIAPTQNDYVHFLFEGKERMMRITKKMLIDLQIGQEVETIVGDELVCVMWQAKPIDCLELHELKQVVVENVSRHQASDMYFPKYVEGGKKSRELHYGQKILQTNYCKNKNFQMFISIVRNKIRSSKKIFGI